MERIDPLTHQINLNLINAHVQALEELARQKTGTRQGRRNKAQISIMMILRGIEDYLPSDIQIAVKQAQALAQEIVEKPR